MRGWWVLVCVCILCAGGQAKGSHLEIAVPDLLDTDLRGPVKVVDTKVSINVSGKFEREREEYDEAGNLLYETEWDADGNLASSATNYYDDDGVFVSRTYINHKKSYTNEWSVFLSPKTHQIAMKKEGPAAAIVYTYNSSGYEVNYRYTNKEGEVVSSSRTKRDEQNRKMQYTRMDADGRPTYTYWFRWLDECTIDRERQKYSQEKKERLHIYNYLKKDPFGNWTQRLMVRYDVGGKEREKVYERLVVRDIEYFFDEVPEPERAIAEVTSEEPGLAERGLPVTDAAHSNRVEDVADALASKTAESVQKKKEAPSGPVAVIDLLKTGRTQEELKACFGYAFDEISDKLVIINCKSEQGRSSGSGFIAKMDGKTYLFTNQHVIMGADSIRLMTADGESLRPRGIELSQRRDIVRMPLEDRPGFEIAEHSAMGSPLGVFGNSEGAGVATELFGEVTGLGADLVEVNAEFVSGNSGSPVLDVNQQVVGIASFVRVIWEPAKKKEKTAEKADADQEAEKKKGEERESKTRRFCYRLDELKWMPVKWKSYNQKYGKMHASSKELAESVFGIMDVWADSPMDEIPVTDDLDRGMKKWVERHNDVIDSYNRRSFGSAKSFYNAYADSLGTLSKTCYERARRIKMFSTQRELSGFLRDELEHNAASLNYAGRYIDGLAEYVSGL